jgi:hypothetical protein
MDNNLHHVLREISNLQLALNKAGGPTKNGELFEEILQIQESVLSKFGLPTNHPACESYLYFETPPTDTEISNRIKLLHELAVDYLSSVPLSDIKILQIARQDYRNALNVLAELSLPTHSYTVFVYEDILLEDKDTIENVLHELRFVSKLGVLQTLGELEQGAIKNETEIIKLLEINGLKYIQQFVFNYKNRK